MKRLLVFVTLALGCRHPVPPPKVCEPPPPEPKVVSVGACMMDAPPDAGAIDAPGDSRGD